jgi:hypothetical protein
MMRWTGMKHSWENLEMSTEFWCGELKEMDVEADVRIDGRVILKMDLNNRIESIDSCIPIKNRVQLQVLVKTILNS